MKTKYEKNLYLKPSTLPNAGKGLFTKVEIPKGEKIVEYKGEIVTWKVCESRFQGDSGGYAFYVNAKHCIDAFDTPQHMARYANDARGLSRIKGVGNNSVYETMKDKKVFIVSTKKIPAFSEIFVSYGDEYWGAIRDKIRKKEREKLKMEKEALKKKETKKNVKTVSKKKTAKKKVKAKSKKK
jgi:hypothetical protein